MPRPVKVTPAQAQRYLEQQERKQPRPRKPRDVLGAWTHHHVAAGIVCRRCLETTTDLYGPLSVGQCRACATGRGIFSLGRFFP